MGSLLLMHPFHASTRQPHPHPDTAGVEVAAQPARRSDRARCCLRRAARGLAHTRVPARDATSDGACEAGHLRRGHRGRHFSGRCAGHHDATGFSSDRPSSRRGRTSPHTVRRARSFNQLHPGASEADVASKLSRGRAPACGGTALWSDIVDETGARQVQELFRKDAGSDSRPPRHHREHFRGRTSPAPVALEAAAHAGRPAADGRTQLHVGGGPSP